MAYAQVTQDRTGGSVTCLENWEYRKTFVENWEYWKTFVENWEYRKTFVENWEYWKTSLENWNILVILTRPNSRNIFTYSY